MTLRALTLGVVLCGGLAASGARLDAHAGNRVVPRTTVAGDTTASVDRLRSAPADRLAAQPAPSEPQDEFRPISELPPEEKLAAGPLLVAAYVIVFLLLFAYVYSLAKRFGGVKAEIDRLEADIKQGRRG